MNIYLPSDIREGSFPRRRRRPVVLKDGVYVPYSHVPRPSGSGHTLTRAEVEKRREERRDRSLKGMAAPSRAVPASGPVRSSSKRLSIELRFTRGAGPVWVPRKKAA